MHTKEFIHFRVGAGLPPRFVLGKLFEAEQQMFRESNGDDGLYLGPFRHYRFLTEADAAICEKSPFPMTIRSK